MAKENGQKKKGEGRAVHADSLLRELGIRHTRKAVNASRVCQGKESENLLSLWRENSLSKAEILAYVETVTEEESGSYIPPKNRIVVTDMDGTLFCETDPTYFDFRLLAHRILEDPDYRDLASEMERSVAEKILDYAETGKLAPGLEMDAGKAIASSFAGMTVTEFNEYVSRFGDLPAPGYEGMKAGGAFYRPMLQLLDYLEEKGFAVYICSGTDRMVIREIVSEIDIAPNQVIGTDRQFLAREQGSTGDTEYCFESDDELVLGGELLNKNLQMSKVELIAREIGMQPVLCLGNSSGDTSMARYVSAKNPYPTRVFMLCCDDTERESGDPEKAEKMRQMCEENGWVPVSMRDDWETIYGPGVRKKQKA